MAVERTAEPFEIEDLIEDNDEDEIEVEIVNPDAVAIESEDEALILDFTGEMVIDHNTNLAELIDETDLESMASELVGDFMSDRETRKEWAMSYVNGMDLLGLKAEERAMPWEGAAGVFHP